MAYKLMAMDLDGTLLNEKWTIDGDVKAVMQKARQKGAHFTLATGRVYFSAVRYARELNLDTPIIASNGALIRNPRTQEIKQHFKVPIHLVQEVITVLKDENVEFYAFTTDEAFTNRKTVFYDLYTAALNMNIQVIPNCFIQMKEAPTCFIIYNSQPNRNEQLREKLMDYFKGQLFFTCSTNSFIDVMHPEASKGNGLSYVAKSLGIPMEETIAIGDGYNDLEMIEKAALGVVVGNAEESVKKRADYVTKGERSKGVIEVIEKFML